VAWNVLQQCVARSKLANKTGELRPEVSRIRLSSSPSSLAEGLAGVSPDDEIRSVRTASVRLVPGCAFEPGRFREPDDFPSPSVGVGSSTESVDVSPSGDVGPVSGENGSAGWLDLDLSDALKPERLHGEIQPADTAEQ
jgi:hypothetical protein